ncbi:hypothetical protein GX586_01595, partial [bacterium]|nr:hypothetical protein [bacterium]
MNHCSRSVLLFLSVICALHFHAGAAELKLNEPAYAKLVLSKDKSKCLLVAFDKTKNSKAESGG